MSKLDIEILIRSPETDLDLDLVEEFAPVDQEHDHLEVDGVVDSRYDDVSILTAWPQQSEMMRQPKR